MKLSAWAPVAFFFAVPALSQNVATIKYVASPTFLLRPDALTRVKPGDVLRANDVLVTGPEGRALVVLLDASEVTLGPRTEIRVVIHDVEKQQTLIEMLHGRVRAKVTPVTKQGGFFRVATPTAVVYALGSELVAETVNPVVDTSEPALTAVVFKHANQLQQKQEANNNPPSISPSPSSTPNDDPLTADVRYILDNLTTMPANVTPPDLDGSENALRLLSGTLPPGTTMTTNAQLSPSYFSHFDSSHLPDPASGIGDPRYNWVLIGQYLFWALSPSTTCPPERCGFGLGGMATVDPPTLQIDDGPPTPPVHSVVGDLTFNPGESLTADRIEDGRLPPTSNPANQIGKNFTFTPPPVSNGGFTVTFNSDNVPVPPAVTDQTTAITSYVPGQPATLNIALPGGYVTINLQAFDSSINGMRYTWQRFWVNVDGSVSSSHVWQGQMDNYSNIQTIRDHLNGSVIAASTEKNPATQNAVTDSAVGSTSPNFIPQLNPTTGSFNALLPFTTLLAHFSPRRSTGQLVVIGGYDSTAAALATIEKIDPTAINEPPAVTPTTGTSGTALKDFVPNGRWGKGGLINGGLSVGRQQYFDSIWPSNGTRTSTGNYVFSTSPSPSTNDSGFTTAGGGSSLNTWNVQDNWNFVLGRHSLTSGVNWTYHRSPDDSFLPFPSFDYSNPRFPLSLAPYVGSTIAPQPGFTFNTRLSNRWMLRGNFSVGDWSWSARTKADSYSFRSDAWTPSRKLTLNTGPSWTSYEQQPKFGPGMSFVYSPQWGGFLTGHGKNTFRGGYRLLYDPPFYNILVNDSSLYSPSVPFLQDRKTIVRGGSGVYSDRLRSNRGAAIIATLHGPVPDRFFFSPGEWFNNSVSSQLPITRTTSGFEKTFLDSNASMGLRIPFSQDVLPGLYSIAYDPAFYNILLNISTSAPNVFLQSDFTTDFAQQHGLIGFLAKGPKISVVPATRTSPTSAMSSTTVDSLLDFPPGQLGPNFKLHISIPVSGTTATALFHYSAVIGQQGAPLYLNTLQSAWVPANGAPADLGALIFNQKDATLQPVSEKVAGPDAIASIHQIATSLSQDNFDSGGRPCAGEVNVDGMSNSPSPKLTLTFTGTATSTPLIVGHATNSGPCPATVIVTNSAVFEPSRIIGAKTKGFLGALAGAALGATTGVTVVPVGKLEEYQPGTSSGVTFTVLGFNPADVQTTPPQTSPTGTNEPPKGGGKEPAEPRPNEVLIPIRSFCLDIHKLAPHPQTAYKFADEKMQRELGPYGEISNRVFRAVQSGEMKLPPGQSLDSGTQWTLWAVIHHLDAKKFTEEYLHIVEKNYHAQNKKFDKETKEKMEQSAAQLFSFVQHFLPGAPKS